MPELFNPQCMISKSWFLLCERHVKILSEYGCFESFPFRQKLFIFVCQTRDFDGLLGTGLPVSMYTTHIPIDNCRFNVTQLKEFFTFSIKDRYQLNYFICIKDFNAQTITSLTLNLFYFFIYCCQHHERKTLVLKYFCYQTDSDQVLNTSIFSTFFLGVSILQLLIIYRIYDYDMLTLS